MHRVVAADRQRIAIARDNPHIKIGIGELYTRRHRRCAAVDGVEAIGFHIIWEARRTADAADEHGVFGRAADFRHGALHRLQNRIVTTARAPANFLVGFPILGRCRFHGGHIVHYKALPIAASISAIVNG